MLAAAAVLDGRRARSDADSPQVLRAQSADAQAHDGAHRRRHGVCGVRIRRGADAGRGPARALVATGQPDSILVTRRASGTEIQSGIERNQAAIVESQPEIAIGPGGVRMVSKETVVLIAQPKRDTGVATNITVRGLGEERPRSSGRRSASSTAMFRRGSTEIVVGKASPSASRAPASASTCASAGASGRWWECRRCRLGLRLRGLG